MLKYFSFSLIAIFFLSSCSKDTPTGTTGETFVKAKAGSTFTFDEYSTDSTNSIIAGSRDTMISTILRTDGAISNKTGVLVVEEKRGQTRDTAYYAYESNGNLSVLTNPSDPYLQMWETVPTGTGTTIIRATEYSVIGIDTSFYHDSTITSLLGTENISIKGQSVPAKKMQLSFRHVITTGGIKYIGLSADNILYFAPSLGFVVKTSLPSRPDLFGGWIDGNIQTMIDYSLK